MEPYFLSLISGSLVTVEWSFVVYWYYCNSFSEPKTLFLIFWMLPSFEWNIWVASLKAGNNFVSMTFCFLLWMSSFRSLSNSRIASSDTRSMKVLPTGWSRPGISKPMGLCLLIPLCSELYRLCDLTFFKSLCEATCCYPSSSSSSSSTWTFRFLYLCLMLSLSRTLKLYLFSKGCLLKKFIYLLNSIKEVASEYKQETQWIPVANTKVKCAKSRVTYLFCLGVGRFRPRWLPSPFWHRCCFWTWPQQVWRGLVCCRTLWDFFGSARRSGRQSFRTRA